MTSTRPAVDGPRSAESTAQNDDSSGERSGDSSGERSGDSTNVRPGVHDDPPSAHPDVDVCRPDAGHRAASTHSDARHPTASISVATGDAERATGTPTDERELYGEPCHEVDAGCDERALYGDPQHETGATGDDPDPDLLFAWFRATPFSAPFPDPSTSRESADATER